MREIRTSGSMSGDGKRGAGHWPQATAPILDSTVATGMVAGRARQLYPGTSDLDLLSDLKGVVDLYPETSEPATGTAQPLDISSAYRALRSRHGYRRGMPTSQHDPQRDQAFSATMPKLRVVAYTTQTR
jgi:hypothetical protein